MGVENTFHYKCKNGVCTKLTIVLDRLEALAIMFNSFVFKQVQEDMRKGEVALEKYIITKTLTKPPEAYPDAKNQPHVLVSLELVFKMSQTLKSHFLMLQCHFGKHS